MSHPAGNGQQLPDAGLNGIVARAKTGIRPLSTREKAEQARLKFAALGEMTAGIAHDFRNVLAVVDSSLRLAAAPDLPERSRHYIESARQGIRLGTKLVEQLLAFAKDGTFDRAPEDANELLTNLQPLLRLVAGSSLRISYDLAPDIPRCRIVPSRFNLAILNLVINARDAMPGGGQVRISTARWSTEAAAPGQAGSAAYVRVRVQDDGPGMAKDIARQIFRPYFTTKGDTGTGLGLPQVSALLHSVGGHLRVESEPGAGTTVELYFPAAKAQ